MSISEGVALKDISQHTSLIFSETSRSTSLISFSVNSWRKISAFKGLTWSGQASPFCHKTQCYLGNDCPSYSEFPPTLRGVCADQWEEILGPSYNSVYHTVLQGNKATKGFLANPPPFPWKAVHRCAKELSTMAPILFISSTGHRMTGSHIFLLCRPFLCLVKIPVLSVSELLDEIIYIKCQQVNMMLLDRNLFKRNTSNFSPIKLFL